MPAAFTRPMTEDTSKTGDKPGRESQPLFATGHIVATAGAVEACARAGVNLMDYVRRHVTGDWGDLQEADIRANESAMQVGDRILGTYGLGNGERLLIVTEGDRSATTVLTPEEY